MDRSKFPKKSGKSHAPGPGELFALGKGDIPRKVSSSGSNSTSASSSAKSSPLMGAAGSSSKSSVGGSSSLKSSSSSEKKREGSSISSSSSSAAKKIRLHGTIGSGTSSSSSSSFTGSASGLSMPKVSSSTASSIGVNVIKSTKVSKKDDDTPDPSMSDFSVEHFLSSIEKGTPFGNHGSMQEVIRYGLLKLRASRDKPDPRLCLGLMRACTNKPQWFQNSQIVDTITNMLSVKKTASEVKTKLMLNGSPMPPFLVCLLTLAYADVETWPTQFFRVWIEDACNERIWVDRAPCKKFVENIQFSFNTNVPNLSLLQSMTETGGPISGSSSPLTLPGETDHGSFDGAFELFDADPVPIMDRAGGSLNMLENMILDYTKDLINRKAPDLPKNAIRALCAASGLVSVRAYALLKLDVWIHHQKTGRQAQDLLMYLCMNADAELDNDTVLNIVKLRYKQKPLANFGAVAIKEMVCRSDSNLRSVLSYIVSNEVSTQRNVNNFQILSVIMLHITASRKLLAEIFIDYLVKREDQTHALRSLLRETIRAARFEFELKSFVQGLTQYRELNWKDGDARERVFTAVTDLILLAMFLSVTPAVRDSALLKGDVKDLNNINIFHHTVADIQDTAIFWLYHVVPKMYRPEKKEFGLAINKVLLRDPMNDVVVKDGWPPETERSIFARLCVDIPLRENVLIWTLLMGVSKDHPLNQPEVLDIVEHCVLRSAQCKGGLELQKPEILQGLFRLCEYKHPEHIALPKGYEPPNLAISKLYWKAWIILCVMCAHNPMTFGKMGWEGYPTLKVLIEMCMTSHFSYPTPSCENADELHLKEMQTAGLERQAILEFEQHLAAASSKQVITEKNSLLLPQLISMHPLGEPRSPPAYVLSQLMSINEQMHLGHLFCRSRNPDFLLDLMQRNSQPMPWLSELVSEGPIDILPVQCLCELMLGQVDRISKSSGGLGGSSGEKASKKAKLSEDSKNLQLLEHLRDCVHKSDDESNNQKEIMDYFFRRLASPKKQNRQQALKGLQLLLSASDTVPEENWLTDTLHNLPIFERTRGVAMVFLRQAIQVENEPEWISRYLEFLSIWSNVEPDEQLAGLAFDTAQLVVERNGVCQTLLRCYPKAYESLFDIFANYLKRTRGPQKESYKWSESQEQVLIQWQKENLEATMNILVVHAVVILLSSYSLVTQCAQNTKATEVKKLKTGRSRVEDYRYQELLEMWFPTNSESPKGFLMNTMEEAVLFPDWIKLRMIRSKNSKLVTAALQHADVDQLMIYVQTFGIPVQSMTALLYCLDTAAERNPEKIHSSASDAQYLKTLVEVQWKRGADGGRIFMQVLNDKLGSDETPMDTSATTQSYTVRYILSDRAPKPSKSKPNLAVELKVKPSSKEDAVVPASSADTGIAIDDYDVTVRRLCKELLNNLTVTKNRRRSSAPTDEPGSPLACIPRRHSMFSETSVHATTETISNEGPVLDQIVEVEPCIVKKAVDLQVQLLFERTISPLACRPFLLNGLAHQSSWKTVDFCINYFLKECDTKYDPTNVLDLVAATVKNPALWHGGDKYVPKHQPEMSMIKLDRNQLLVLADYIIEEISCTVIRNAKFSISNLLGPSHRPPPQASAKPKQKLKERVRLWLLCCRNDKDVVNGIIRDILSKRSNSPHAKKFLAQLYLEFPEAMLGGTWQECDDIVMSDEELSSTLDTISFNLINAVALNEPGKDWQKKAQHYLEPALRKVASNHPLLLLRQLPLMVTLLQGRVHLDFGVFQAQNHHIPFKIFLGLWDFMQPQILKHFKTLKEALQLYLKLFENFAHIKDFSLEVRRFSILMHNLWLKNNREVEDFMEPYHKLLTDIGALKNYLDVSPLHNLIECLVPLQSRRAYAVPVSGYSTETGVSDLENDAIMMFQDRMQHISSADDVYPVLQDLDVASNRNPSMLEYFAERMKSLLVSPNEACRTLAFSLILKHMTYTPKSRNVYFDAVMALLYTDNYHVRETIIERISEFVMLSNERADEILMRLFELGTSSSMNVQPAVAKTLAIFRSCTAT